jgi:hypothetical protein
MDSEGFLHFQLPLEARNSIRSEAEKRQFGPKLFKLHNNYRFLKADQEEIMLKCGEELEAVKMEIQSFASEICAKCEKGKEKLMIMREKYELALSEAMKEVCMHSFEKWDYKKESLAHIIANFDAETMSIASLFCCSVKAEIDRMRDMVRIQLETALPALSYLNYCDGIIDSTKSSSKPLIIPDFSSQDLVFIPEIDGRKGSLSPAAPSDSDCIAPEPGFSLLVSCLNPKCVQNGSLFYLEKGFGVFNLAEVSSDLKCPVCKRKIGEAITCGFYQAKGKFEGGLSNLEVVERVIVADTEEFRQLTEIGDRAWRYITISCYKLQPN